jgi:hypothetical protein
MRTHVSALDDDRLNQPPPKEKAKRQKEKELRNEKWVEGKERGKREERSDTREDSGT